MDTGRSPVHGSKGEAGLGDEQPKEHRRSFAATLNSQAQPYHRLNLTFIAPKLVQGAKMVEVPAAVTLAGEERWKYTLLGNVLGLNPRLSEMINFTKLRWKGIGAVTIHQMGAGLFVFQFQSEAEKQAVLEQGPWSFSRRPLILRSWEVGMPLNKPTTVSLPIWIQFPFLPLDLWTAEGLSHIASFIGKPLYADRNTSEQRRLAYARICVEITVDSELPASIPVRYASGDVHHQPVKFEWVPMKCSKCGVFGHGDQSCTREKGDNVAAGKGKENKSMMEQTKKPQAKGSSNPAALAEGENTQTLMEKGVVSSPVASVAGCEVREASNITVHTPAEPDLATKVAAEVAVGSIPVLTKAGNEGKQDLFTTCNSPSSASADHEGPPNTYANIVKSNPIVNFKGLAKGKKGGGKKKPQVIPSS